MLETKNTKAAAPTVEELQAQLATEKAAREEAEKNAEELNSQLAIAESQKAAPKGIVKIGKKSYRVITPRFTLKGFGTLTVEDLKKSDNGDALKEVLSGKYNILKEIEKEADNV